MIGLRFLGIVLAPAGAVLMLLGGWWPVAMGNGGPTLLRRLVETPDPATLAAFVVTPAGAAVLAASLALLTWPRR